MCSKYYNYAVSNQGVKESHGDNYTLDYFTDVIRKEAVQFIKESANSSFFMYIATPAPHRPATPAPQYDNTFIGEMAPRTPSFHYNGTDKHWIISKGKEHSYMYFFPNYHLLSLLLFEGTPYMTSDIIGLVDELYEMRLETLLSVQDLLQDLIETLEVCFMTIIIMSQRQYYVLCMVSIPILWFLSFISSLPSNSSRWSIFWITHLFSTTVTMVLMIPRVYTLACIISSFFLGYHLGQFNQQVSHLIYKCSLLAFLFPKFVLMACSLFSTSHLLINFFREKSANPMMKIFVSH